jgi:hypothetical protein
MPETLSEAPPAPKLTPLERVTQWEPVLTSHGWTVHITYTPERARLEATHPSGAAVMVTSGIAGRTGSGSTQRYALQSTDKPLPWFGVGNGVLETFIATRILTGGKRRVTSKCQCRTKAGRPKVRYTTEVRAVRAMAEARRQRARNGQEETAECRAYRCPADDRAWHTSSQPVWHDEPGDSRLWG